MAANIKIFLFCPIPETQKPMTEFILFQENPLFHWITFSKKKYKKIFAFFLLFLFFFTLSFLFPFFSFQFSLSFFFLSFFFFACFLFFFFFLVFFRWYQLENRLNNSRVFYEEGSWYDGQIWEKPFSLIKNERLVSTQKIQPILNRLSNILFWISFSLAFLFICFFF
jgi:hypothetical protein